MWTLAHLFRLLLLTTAYLFSGASEGTVLVEDRTVARVGDRVLFVSDFNKISRQMQSLKCAQKNALLLNFLKPKRGWEVHLKTSDESLRSHHRWIGRVVSLIKLQDYAKENLYNWTPNEKKVAKYSRCLEKYSLSLGDIVPLMQLEEMLKDRASELSRSKRGKGGYKQLEELSRSVSKRVKHRFMYKVPTS